MKTSYRDKGAIGALLDEYEKALLALHRLLNEVSKTELTAIVDTNTKDKDCKSIQTVLTHVVRAGYGYAIEIRNLQGETNSFKERKTEDTVLAYQSALHNMFAYQEQVFLDYPNVQLEEKDNQKKILVSWGQTYDIEQLLEHAIVHILRHRRQIERFLIRLRSKQSI